jgi:hypothetical protein
METITTLSPWGIIQFLVFVLVAGLAYYYRRSDKDRDEAIKQLHTDFKEGAEKINDLSSEFLVVKTQHTEGYPSHKSCTERLGRLESKVEICEQLKGKRGD